MTDQAPDGYMIIKPAQFEWTDDLSKFGKDGWQYVKEWPDRRQMLGRVDPNSKYVEMCTEIWNDPSQQS